MSAETPLWFDSTYYAEQKLDQLSLIKWDGKTGWTYSAYLDELAKYDATPYENFVASNEVHNLRLTNLSPNPLFNVNEYLTALADYANRTGYSYPGYKAGEWTAQKAMEHMFNDYHVSAWDHFTLAGQYDLINPSNNFDITAYYDQLTAWRNSYVDPKTGAKGWEGRTDWTRLDVIEDNIWNETNPIEGLFGEAAGSGIHPQAVPASQRVTVDSNWNPWVEVEASVPVTPTRPGGSSSSSSGSGSGSGSSNSGSDNSDDDAWQPDQTVEVRNEAAIYAGEDGENTLFVANGGLNPASVIDGGANSENVLTVDMGKGGSFAGFDGVNGGPNLTNVQTVNLVNNKAETFTFNGKNTAGVENWNIENGLVNLSDLPDDDAAIGLKNITRGGDVSIGFNDAVTKAGDASLILNVDNVGKQVTEVEGDPLNVQANAVSKVTVNSAADSENLISLAGVEDAKEITVQGAGQVSLADMGDKVETVDASSLKGQFIATLSGENAPATIKGGAGSEDSLIIAKSGEYGGNWSGIENVVVGGGEDGYVDLDGSNISSLENIIVNRWTPEMPADLYVGNLKAETISVEDSSYAPDEDSDGYGRSFWVNLDGEIGDIQYTARKPYDGMDNGTRDVVVTKTAIGTNFQTTADGDAIIKVEEGVSLGGTFYFSQADNVEITGPGQFGNWRWLDVDAPQAKTITADLGGDSSLNMAAVNGAATATVKGDNNYVWANGNIATITDGAGSNTLQMSVRDNGTITGGGGADRFVIDGMTVNGSENPGQPEVITATIIGKDSVDVESFEIQGYNVYTSMAVTIEGYDATDARIDTSNGGFAWVDQEQAEELIARLFGLEIGDIETVNNDHDDVCGYYDSANKTAYGFTWNAMGEINVGVKLTDIDSPELAAHALGFESYPYRPVVRLEPGQLIYSSPVDSEGLPLPTTFSAVVMANPDDSSLVEGVQITGSGSDTLEVGMYSDFDGLGLNGSVTGVLILSLVNELSSDGADQLVRFNAENIGGGGRLQLLGGQFDVYNLQRGIWSLHLEDMREPDSIVMVEYADGVLDDYGGDLDLVVEGVGSEESFLLPVITGVTNLHLYSAAMWNEDSSSGNWVDVSDLSEVSSLVISFYNDLNIIAQNMMTNDAVNLYAETSSDSAVLKGSLEFINTPSLYFHNDNGNVGTAEDSLLLSAVKAEEAVLNIYGSTNLELHAKNAAVVLNTDDGLPEFINLKVDADTFTSNGQIRADQVSVDLSDVEANSENPDIVLWARASAKFWSAKVGTDAHAFAQNAELTGSAGDDHFSFQVTESAVLTGNGGHDEFVANANKSTAEGAQVIEVAFNGSCAEGSQDTFFINTWQDEAAPETNAKMALTVTGYDSGDEFKIINRHPTDQSIEPGEQLAFAAVTESEAKDALNEMFGIDLTGLKQIMGKDGQTYAYFGQDVSGTGFAYGFAPGENGEIVAVVKLDDVTAALAQDAFAPGAAQA